MSKHPYDTGLRKAAPEVTAAPWSAAQQEARRGLSHG
jgi:hypothetical protein